MTVILIEATMEDAKGKQIHKKRNINKEFGSMTELMEYRNRWQKRLGKIIFLTYKTK